MSSSNEIRLEGAPVSGGIAIGIPYFLSPLEEELVPEFSIGVGEIDEEIARYRKALFSSREDLQRLQKTLKKDGSFEAVTIIDTHLQMLSDPLMTTHMEERIRDMRRNTEVVFRSAIKEFEDRFSKVKDSFFEERFVDVKDISKRILNHLRPQSLKLLADTAPRSIVFAYELIPSYTAAAVTSHVSGFVSQLGGGNSHAALIARSKAIPYVTNIDIATVQDHAPKMVIIDGLSGLIILDPTRETFLEYEQKRAKQKSHYQLLEEADHHKAETADGHAVSVFANISSLSEIDLMHEHGAAGVGLFRSEYLFLENPTLFENEEEQYLAYRELAEKGNGLPIVIRVLDLGGDKSHAVFGMPQKEPHNLQGCRGIRLLLRCKEIFKTQLRALLRASAHGNIRILLPLISDIEELRQSKEILHDVQKELAARSIPHNEKILMGCMVEVPSAVVISSTLAHESDFLSVGTNDLVQYTLGVDRSNPLMSDFYFPAHPSIIRMIKVTAEEAKRCNKPIAICGEIASSPLFIPLLLGLGVEEFSCAPRYIPLVKKALRMTPLARAKKLAEEVLTLKTPAEISRLLAEASETILK